MRDIASELIELLSRKSEPISVNQACEELHCDRTRFMREYKKPLHEGLIIEEKGVRGSKLLSLRMGSFVINFLTHPKFIYEAENTLKKYMKELDNLKKPIMRRSSNNNDYYFPSKESKKILRQIDSIMSGLAIHALTFAILCSSDLVEEELKKYALENQKTCIKIIEHVEKESFKIDPWLSFYGILRKIPSFQMYKNVIAISNFERAKHLFENALSFARKHKYDEAIKCCDTVLKFDQYSAGAYYTKAQIYSMQNKVGEALENLEKSMMYMPSLYRSVERDRVDFVRIEDHPKFKRIINNAKAQFPTLK